MENNYNQGLLSEVVVVSTPYTNEQKRQRKESLERWLNEFEATNYPGRPVTRQYHEVRSTYLELTNS